MRRLPLGLLCLVVVAGCQPRAVEDESAAVRQIIEAYNANLARWYEAGMMDSVAWVFAADARQMGPNTEPLVGREAIREFWSQVAGLGTWTFEINTEEVTAYGPVAVERGTYTLDFKPGDAALPGMAASADTGNHLVEWRLEDGRWLIVNHVATSQRSVESLCAQQ
jgi:ketosteroid isomerase-like protein